VLREFLARNSLGLLALYDRLGGGGLSSGSILALGIMPYLSARTFRYLLAIVSPSVAAMETSFTGRRVLSRWTMGLTAALSVIQAYGFTRFTLSLPGAVAQPGLAYTLQTVGVLSAAAIVMGRLCALATETEAETAADDALPEPARPLAINGSPGTVDRGGGNRVATPLPRRDH
jgi:preprotein translocase subunit SecY